MRLGLQFGRLYINRDRTEGHEKIMKDYFNPNATYAEKYFFNSFGCASVSFSPLQLPWRSMMIGSNSGGTHVERYVRALLWSVLRLFEFYLWVFGPCHWWVCSDRRGHMHWRNYEICLCFSECVWTRVLEITKYQGHRKSSGNWSNNRLFRHA